MDETDRQRIAGRKWAEEAIDFAASEGGNFHEGFLRQIKRVYADTIEKRDPDVMDEQEAVAFEAEDAGFSKHPGTWGEIDREFIAWIADRNKRLARYTRSKRFRERS